MRVSVVIPVFNEEKYIRECVESLFTQTVPQEIIIIDDGSTDNTLKVLNSFSEKITILKQKHLGPATARNLGASKAKGEILVFVDSDMVFERNFVENLIKPIVENKAIGTFSKEEYVLNKDNIWSMCWNIEKGLPVDRMHGKDYPQSQEVFRAILKKEFQKVGGFTPLGYIDDYTLAEKLGIKAVVAEGAKYYHRNPQTLKEVYSQARWIGKTEYKFRKIKNENIMRLFLLIRHFPLVSLIVGFLKSINFKLPQFIVFKIIYDFAIEVSLLKSFFEEQKYK